MEKKITTPVLAGIIISLILIVESIIMYLTGLYLQTWAQYIGFAVFVAGIIWAVINNAKEKNSDVTYGQLFGFGFKIVAVVTCLMILYAVLSGFIFPDAKQKIMDMARQNALAKPGADADQVDKGMDIFSKNYTLFIVLGLLFWYLLVGVVVSLIAAAIPKKNPRSPL
jgi:type III secretory pathway component EscS